MKLQVNANTATTIAGTGALLAQMLVLLGVLPLDKIEQVTLLSASLAAILYNPKRDITP
jgi:hypothetical protein